MRHGHRADRQPASGCSRHTVQGPRVHARLRSPRCRGVRVAEASAARRSSWPTYRRSASPPRRGRPAGHRARQLHVGLDLRRLQGRTQTWRRRWAGVRAARRWRCGSRWAAGSPRCRCVRDCRSWPAQSTKEPDEVARRRSAFPAANRWRSSHSAATGSTPSISRRSGALEGCRVIVGHGRGRGGQRDAPRRSQDVRAGLPLRGPGARGGRRGVQAGLRHHLRNVMANQTALLYTSRGHFVEYDVLVAEMPRFIRCGFIDHADLFSGRWTPHLDAVVSQPAPPEQPAVNGAGRRRADRSGS